MDLQIEGFVISETPNGESSKILNILTKEKGIIGVIAKGAKNLKNPLRIKACKFTYGIFYMRYYDNKLSILKDVDIIDKLTTIKKDITLISYMSYLTELTTQVYRESENSDIYDLFISALLKINNNFTPIVITNMIELKYLKYLGVDIHLSSCVSCGNTSNILTISMTKSGYICSNCFNNEEILSTKVIKTIRLYKLIEINKITKLDLDLDAVNTINNFISEYYETYTGMYLNSKKFLKQLIDIN